MNTLKSKNHLLVHSYFNLSSLNHLYSTASSIKIPNYIPRGKTDILEALASTVKQNPNYLPYGFYSDPRLTPKNSREYRNYGLAKESGMRAAQYFMKTYPELFYRDQAEPKIEKLSYPDVFNEQMQFELDDIQTSINKRNVNNAIIAYRKLNEQNVDIPFELRLSLFQLVCFFNSKDPFEYIEELPFTRKMNLRIYEMNNVWDEGGLAEELWTSFFSNENNVEANSTYILGLIRFGAFDKAYNLFKQKFEKEKSSINLEAFNSLIRSLPFINVLNKDLSAIDNLLKLINENEFSPTVDTFNAFFFALSFSKAERKDIIKLTEKLLLDIKTLDLDAGLGTYSYVLSIFYAYDNQSNSSNNDIIYKIIDKIEKKTIKPTSKDDLMFFEEAMRITAVYLHDVELAKRIYNLFEKNNNMYLNFFRECNIYENFFVALAKGATTEELFNYYSKICPGIFFPSPSFFESLVDHLIVFNSFDYIERFFEELDKYSYYNLNNLNHKMFHLMVSVPRSERTDKLFEEFLFKCLDSYARTQVNMKHEASIEKNAKMIYSLLDNLLLIDREAEVANYIVENGDEVQMVEKREAKKFYSKVVSRLIIKNKPLEAIKLIKFSIASEIVGGLDDELTDLVRNSNELSPKHRQIINSLLILSN